MVASRFPRGIHKSLEAAKAALTETHGERWQIRGSYIFVFNRYSGDWVYEYDLIRTRSGRVGIYWPGKD